MKVGTPRTAESQCLATTPPHAPTAIPLVQAVPPSRVPRHAAYATAGRFRWPHQVVSTLTHRLRYWTVSGERQKELRIDRASDKVMGAAYVFLNAMLSDEALDKHFGALRRQIRRLDKHGNVRGDLSEESTRMLTEAADRTAGSRDKAKYKILAFHREELLYPLHDSADFRHADAILLTLERRMVASIAIYGPALRQIAYAGTSDLAPLESLRVAAQNALASEVLAGDGAGSAAIQERNDGLATAASRLPYRVLVRLDAVLTSAGYIMDDATEPLPQADAASSVHDGCMPAPCEAFLADVGRVVRKRLTYLGGESSSRR
ncbi:hypothetical protein [Bordetella flabilis]|uniref:Uncharacterized protein n=1 Tax=Bordetella flabilis TaxID=463014 RepID=A0A193G7M2_9BORD|nr:hypothetical protein [Bordetella flabilis]ANN75820.1 hypothetical protein BAU07_00595 [Bordetella flabilis]